MASPRTYPEVPDFAWRTGDALPVNDALSELAVMYNFPDDFGLETKLREALYTTVNYASLFPRATPKQLGAFFECGESATRHLREVFAKFGPSPRFALSKLGFEIPNLAELDEELQRFEMVCARAKNEKSVGKKRLGRRGEPDLNQLIYELVSIWESGFGDKAKWYTNTYGVFGGPFFEFVEHVLEIAGLRIHSNASLGNRIGRVRKKIRARDP